jgi:hypothetical protein
VHSPLEIP